jgi:hypothetical protein
VEKPLTPAQAQPIKTARTTNPMESQFEQLGYFETLVDQETGRQIGNRNLGKTLPEGRTVGHAGGIEITISESFTVDRGHKTGIPVKLKAPRKYFSIIFALCGRRIS